MFSTKIFEKDFCHSTKILLFVKIFSVLQNNFICSTNNFSVQSRFLSSRFLLVSKTYLIFQNFINFYLFRFILEKQHFNLMVSGKSSNFFYRKTSKFNIFFVFLHLFYFILFYLKC